MEVKREVSIGEDGHQITTYLINSSQPEIIFTIIFDGEEIIFMDTTITAIEPTAASGSY